MESLKCTELDRLNDNNTTVEICLLISYIEDIINECSKEVTLPNCITLTGLSTACVILLFNLCILNLLFSLGIIRFTITVPDY
jgi:hypothetical protein